MSAPVGKYRAKADCRAGGLFRRAGDEFEMPMLKVVPAHLEEIGASGSGQEDIGAAGKSEAAVKTSAKKAFAKADKGKAKGGKPAAVPKEAQVGKEDIGAAAATPVQDVTSKDMVTQ